MERSDVKVIMQISVIIPVYNTAQYVRKAVKSAVAQPETAEVIVVEDGSQDNSLAVCEELAAKYPSVHLYRHPDKRNHGCAASTNLGILNSTCNYVAFLDADDFFLPNRFSEPARLFQGDPELEGVYEAVGRFVESEAAGQRWTMSGRPVRRLITVTKEVSSEHLFTGLLKGGIGFFHSNGLVVKRGIFDKTGLYEEYLRLHQDTAMNIKMAACAKLAGGRLDEPVAMFRVHINNRISAPRPKHEVYQAKLTCWETVWRWCKENVDGDMQKLALKRLLRHAMSAPRFDRGFPVWARGIQKKLQLTLLLFGHPSLLVEQLFWKRFLPSPRYWAQHLQDRTSGRSNQNKRIATLYKNKDYLHAYREHTDIRVEHDPHAAIGGMWDAIGKLQCEFLKRNGLKRHHKLLDIGCGTLRGGRHLIDYLDAMNYTGTDISERAIQYGMDLVRREGISEKQPRLLVSTTGNLKFGEFDGETFDYILAHSVFTHLKPEHIEECFHHIGRIMNDASAFFFTFNESPQFIQTGLKDFAYPMHFFQSLANECGFTLADNTGDYQHPRGQRMALVSKKEIHGHLWEDTVSIPKSGQRRSHESAR